MTIKINNEKDLIYSPLKWQLANLSYTASGYGNKIPTRYKFKYNNKFYRVYAIIYSNNGSIYIISKKEKIYLVEY